MTISAPIFGTFAQMNPDFSGCYIAVTDNDISTTALFDNKTTMYAHIRQQFEENGAEQVQTTILGSDGKIETRLNSKMAIYQTSDDCYRGGLIEPEVGENIFVTYYQQSVRR